MEIRVAIIAFSAVGASAAGTVDGYRGTSHGGLIDILEEFGHTVVEPGDKRATHFVSLDHNARSFGLIATAIPRESRTLVVFEPRVVLPANYRAQVRREYGNVIVMFAEATSESFLEWPQRDWKAHPPAKAKRTPGSTAVVNANKLSAIRGSLYGLRRRVIAQFAAEGLPLTLAGPNWSRRGWALAKENAKAVAYAVVNKQAIDPREWAGTVPTSGSITYLGKVDDKDAVLLASEFAIVIENSATYVSEKLFDAVIAGCVPLYVGPALSEYGIPDSVAVLLPPHAPDFTEAVRSLSSEEKDAVLAAGRAWLGSDKTETRWAMPHALRRLAREIHDSINEEESQA